MGPGFRHVFVESGSCRHVSLQVGGAICPADQFFGHVVTVEGSSSPFPHTHTHTHTHTGMVSTIPVYVHWGPGTHWVVVVRRWVSAPISHPPTHTHAHTHGDGSHHPRVCVLGSWETLGRGRSRAEGCMGFWFFPPVRPVAKVSPYWLVAFDVELQPFHKVFKQGQNGPRLFFLGSSNP